MKVRALIVCGLAWGLVVGVVGMAQVTQGSTAEFTVGTLIQLSLTTATIDFGTLKEGDYNRGYKELLKCQVVTIKSNMPWTLKVAANTGTWIGPWGKPSTDLEWRVVDGTYTGLTTTATTVATGTRGVTTRTMEFRVLVSWENDPAGDYSLGFTYTLTAP